MHEIVDGVHGHPELGAVFARREGLPSSALGRIGEIGVSTSEGGKRLIPQFMSDMPMFRHRHARGRNRR